MTNVLQNIHRKIDCEKKEYKNILENNNTIIGRYFEYIKYSLIENKTILNSKIEFEYNSHKIKIQDIIQNNSSFSAKRTIRQLHHLSGLLSFDVYSCENKDILGNIDNE